MLAIKEKNDSSIQQPLKLIVATAVQQLSPDHKQVMLNTDLLIITFYNH